MRIKPTKRDFSPITALKFGPFLCLVIYKFVWSVMNSMISEVRKSSKISKTSLHSCCCMTSEGDGTI